MTLKGVHKLNFRTRRNQLPFQLDQTKGGEGPHMMFYLKDDPIRPDLTCLQSSIMHHHTFVFYTELIQPDLS